MPPVDDLQCDATSASVPGRNRHVNRAGGVETAHRRQQDNALNMPRAAKTSNHRLSSRAMKQHVGFDAPRSRFIDFDEEGRENPWRVPPYLRNRDRSWWPERCSFSSLCRGASCSNAQISLTRRSTSLRQSLTRAALEADGHYTRSLLSTS